MSTTTEQRAPSAHQYEPTATRRGALAALTGGAFLAAGGTAEATSPDAGLFALRDRYFEALAASEAAVNHVDACEAAYDAAVPDMPSALILRAEDVLDLAFPIRAEFVDCYLEARHIEILRSKPRRRRAPAYWKVVRSTGGPAKLVEISRAEFENAPAGVDVTDTNFMRACPVAQARADEIVAAWDAHEAACHALPEWKALEAAVAAHDAAAATRNDLERQICQMPATTLDGLRTRAEILVKWFDGDLTDLQDDRSLDSALMWATMRDLAAI